MVRLKPWQWAVLGLPIALVVSFLIISAGFQIHAWGISWIWAIVGLLFVGWRWLLVKWTQPALAQVEAIVTELSADLQSETPTTEPANTSLQQAEAALQETLQAARTDPPLWEDSNLFWQRCQTLISAIAHVYYPQTKQPLLNIYIPQAYKLLRGTIDDLDQWMQRLTPALNQVTIGQAYQAYEVYQKLEPSARKIWQAWNWAQWLLNPAAAIAKTATQRTSSRATQELLSNLSQLMREAALRNLGRQAIVLYSGSANPGLEEMPIAESVLPKAQTQTLRAIIAQANPSQVVEQAPVNLLLVGRTGAGKSSLINTLFVEAQAEVDALPSTDRIQDYHWQTATGETLTLWDSPGYEQIDRADFRDQVLDHAAHADLVLLATPALDPALQMDLDFLKDLQAEVPDLPTIVIVTQVDRLRPIREWQPPYDWQKGDRPKEISIREATHYRASLLSQCPLVLPVVTSSETRQPWGMETLSLAILDSIAPAKQLRLARFFKNLDARTVGAAKTIDHYTFQMATTQGLTAFLKSPVLGFISTLATGSPTLALLLAEKIPIEQLPIVIGKLQLAYDLFNLLTADQPNSPSFDFRAIWGLLIENSASPEHNAWAFGHALTEYWTQSLTSEQLRSRFEHYLTIAPNVRN